MLAARNSKVLRNSPLPSTSKMRGGSAEQVGMLAPRAQLLTLQSLAETYILDTMLEAGLSRVRP